MSRTIAEDTRCFTARGVIAAGAKPGMTAFRMANAEGFEALIKLLWQPVHFGGYRLFLLCPRCSGKSKNIYAAERGLACQKCQGLANRTENLSRPQRKRVKLEKVMKAAGCDTPSLLLP